MLFVFEIFGWIGLLAIAVILSLLAAKILIISAMVVCKFIGHIFGPIIVTLRKNINLNAPRFKTHRKKKLKFYEDYSKFR